MYLPYDSLNENRLERLIGTQASALICGRYYTWTQKLKPIRLRVYVEKLRWRCDMRVGGGEGNRIFIF